MYVNYSTDLRLLLGHQVPVEKPGSWPLWRCRCRGWETPPPPGLPTDSTFPPRSGIDTVVYDGSADPGGRACAMEKLVVIDLPTDI